MVHFGVELHRGFQVSQRALGLTQSQATLPELDAGARALRVELRSLLEKLGYDVRPLAPGFEVLKDAGFPTVKK